MLSADLTLVAFARSSRASRAQATPHTHTINAETPMPPARKSSRRLGPPHRRPLPCFSAQQSK
eukprot:1303922-Prymnesium_polylepis.2